MVKVQEFIKRVGMADHDELAQKLGIKKGTVDAWSSGSRCPTYEVCVKLLDMGMTVEELFGKAYQSSVQKTHEEFDAAVAASLQRVFAKIGKL